MVFQDPYSSLNPSRVIGQSIGEPLEVHEKLSSGDRHERVRELLRQVNLSPDFYERYPYEFSGGQRFLSGLQHEGLKFSSAHRACRGAISPDKHFSAFFTRGGTLGGNHGHNDAWSTFVEFFL